MQISTSWKPIKTAPKGSSPSNPAGEHWILGINSYGEQKVIRWCMEYPCTEGVWMFAYAPTDYIDNIQTFDPEYWTELPEKPKKENK